MRIKNSTKTSYKTCIGSFLGVLDWVARKNCEWKKPLDIYEN
jgi:hypothetical protein